MKPYKVADVSDLQNGNFLIRPHNGICFTRDVPFLQARMHLDCFHYFILWWLPEGQYLPSRCLAEHTGPDNTSVWKRKKIPDDHKLTLSQGMKTILRQSLECFLFDKPYSGQLGDSGTWKKR